MLIRPSTTFANPVLSPHTEDYGDRTFEIKLEIEEVPDAGEVLLKGLYILDDQEVHDLIRSNLATVCVTVECTETYFQQFMKLQESTFTLDYKNGELRGRVSIQAVVVASTDDLALKSSYISAEYPPHTKTIQLGDLVAASDIHTFEAGLDKLLPMESIFRLIASENVDDGIFNVGLDNEAIQIEVNRNLFDTIYGIRGTSSRDILLPSLYLPAVMNALDAMRNKGYEGHRWYRVIQARCSHDGITLDGNTDLAGAAQRLLEGPLGQLRRIFNEEEK